MTALALLAATTCPLFAVGPAQEHPIKLPDGKTVTARDPYGGTLSRNRLFFDFSVRGDTSSLQKAEWALDGKPMRTDDRAPFEWRAQSGSKKRMPAGDHTVTVTVTTAAGQASTQFALTATDCQAAGALLEIPRRPGTTTLGASAAAEPAKVQPPFDGVTFAATKNVVARGTARGTLELGARRIRFTGGVHRGKLRLAFHPGRKRFLTVTGLPKGTKTVRVTLAGGAVRLRDAGKAFRVDVTLTGGGSSATVRTGGRYA